MRGGEYAILDSQCCLVKNIVTVVFFRSRTATRWGQSEGGGSSRMGQQPIQPCHSWRWYDIFCRPFSFPEESIHGWHVLQIWHYPTVFSGATSSTREINKLIFFIKKKSQPFQTTRCKQRCKFCETNHSNARQMMDIWPIFYLINK